MIEKILERLERYKKLRSDNTPYGIGVLNGYAEAIEIVKEESKNGGWIPCSERLPEKDQRCLVQYNGAMSGFEDYTDVDVYNGEVFEFFGIKYVIAWQPLPAPYQKGE